MELNWTTFALEIINFLVLVWILKRFFYRPVRNVIDQRRKAIQKEIDDAKAVRSEAEAIGVQYRDHLAAWDQEREVARQALQREIEAERVRLREALAAEIGQEREKRSVLEERRLADIRCHADEAAWAMTGRFARKLLERLAGPELEARIAELALEDLAHLPGERIRAMGGAVTGDWGPVVVQSAYPLDEARRTAIRQTVGGRLGGGSAEWRFEEVPELLAGIRVSIGDWTMAANLRDELRQFLEAGREPG